MMAPALSPAALGLMRAICRRSGVTRDRILLTSWTSVDWQSLTFNGERHEAEIRVTGPGSDSIAARIVDEIAEAEFSILGQVVADIAATAASPDQGDGSISLSIEALTIAE